VLAALEQDGIGRVISDDGGVQPQVSLCQPEHHQHKESISKTPAWGLSLTCRHMCVCVQPVPSWLLIATVSVM